MATKSSNRDKLLNEGLRVVHERGYMGASVRDIVGAAGVPQGSFTNHFVSKEAFGLEVLDLYCEDNSHVIRDTLLNDALPPLQRLGAYIDANLARLSRDEMRYGCLYGNLSAEASDHSEPIRQRLVEIFDGVEDAVTYCLRVAVAHGDLPASTDCDDIGAYFVASLQGAFLLAKVRRTSAPVERFKRLVFTKLLT
jgi:TetR/AcrR family transcriptional repressor of nem operon